MLVELVAPRRRWVERATSPFRPATSRAKGRRRSLHGTAQKIPAAFPAGAAGCRAARAGSPCHPRLDRSPLWSAALKLRLHGCGIVIEQVREKWEPLRWQILLSLRDIFSKGIPRAIRFGWCREFHRQISRTQASTCLPSHERSMCASNRHSSNVLP